MLLVSIPVSSSPLIANFTGGETPVGPLAILPLGVVLLLGVVPGILSGKVLPRLVWPLLLFLALAIFSTALSTWLPLIPFKGITSGGRIARAFLTLIIGLGFYISAIILVDTQDRLQTSLRALFWGLILLLIWSSVQAVLVLDGSDRVPLIITQLHHIFSIRDPLQDRVVGMAFEPSWLGNQLVVLYIPLLLALVLHKRSVFPVRLLGISVELLLLCWAMFILLLTQSRISMMSLLALVVCFYVWAGTGFIRRFMRRKNLYPVRRGMGLLFNLAALLLVSAVAVAVLVGGIWSMSKFDERMEDVLRIPSRLQEDRYFHPNEAVFAISDRLAFAERLVYWSFGWRTFSEHPIFGVGLGNTGFFFEENLPPYGHQLTEIRNVFVRQEYGFPNPKNLWVRTLSETGLAGFSSFMIWYILVGYSAFVMWRKGTGLPRVMGLAGSMIFIIQIVEGFSLDTYALPQLWVGLGLISAGFGQSGLFREP